MVSVPAGSEAAGVVVVPPVVVVPVVVVVPAPESGEVGGVPSCAFRSEERFVRVWFVSAAFGRNFFTLLASISLCATTVAICGAAQFGTVLDDPAAAAVETPATAHAAASMARR
jgi:hypothetical protein